MNVNRKVGTAFEKDLCISLAGYGFWCHNMAQNAQGQPFDVIAARNGRAYPIDCKDCEKDVFRLSRIEENQASAMALWRLTGNEESWFALRLTDSSVWMLAFSRLEMLGLTKTVLSKSEIKKNGIPLREWVERCE